MKLRGFVVAYLVGVLVGGVCLGQRGIDDAYGIVRQRIQPEIVMLQGEVMRVKTGPCEKTTGQAVIGSHFFLKTDTGHEYNIHLGPASVMEGLMAILTIGREVTVQVFRTDKMASMHAVAVTVAIGRELYRLREENLRPVWAGHPLATAGAMSVALPSGAGRGAGRIRCDHGSVMQRGEFCGRRVRMRWRTGW